MGEEKNGKGCRQEYAELLCDFMFKRVFGSEANKDVLIGFLNMIMEDVNIKEVDFIPTEHLGLTEQDRKAVFDISCTCDDGRTLIIEMQKGFQEHFRERRSTTRASRSTSRDERRRRSSSRNVERARSSSGTTDSSLSRWWRS